MMAAARFDRKEIVNLLIDKGASMELTINVKQMIEENGYQ